MRYSDTRDQSAEYLRLVIPEMSRHEAAFHPLTYTVWYEYVANRNPDFRAAVDRLVADSGRLAEEHIERLYGDHLAAQERRDSESLRSGLERLLRSLAVSTSEVDASASVFSASLDAAGQTLRGGVDAGHLQALIEGLTTSACQMRESVQHLKTRLSSTKEELTELRAALARAQGEALRDALTGLVNRRGFDAAVSNTLARVSDRAVAPSLIMVDIDHFKRINDSYGHLFGDKVIRAVARTMDASCSRGATVARLGGEEFAALLPQTQIDAAVALAERLRATVQQGRIRRIDSSEMIGDVTISIGVTRYEPREAAEQFLNRADAALYASKRNGRNRVTALAS